MTLEKLKEFEKEHPQYENLFKPILAEFDKISREEFAKAFKAIDARMKAIQQENLNKFNPPEEDVKVIDEAFTELLKQINKDISANVKAQFEKYAK